MVDRVRQQRSRFSRCGSARRSAELRPSGPAPAQAHTIITIMVSENRHMTISVPPNTVIPAFPGAGSTPGAAAPQALDAGERWYVVQTQPNREAVALVNLHRQGFRTFMPQIVKTVRHARRTRTQQVPLFPGYFFTALDPDCAPWRRINGSLGVVSLIMGGDRPLPIPEGIVESLAVLTDNRGVADFGRKLEIGSDVRILVGPSPTTLGRSPTLTARAAPGCSSRSWGPRALLRSPVGPSSPQASVLVAQPSAWVPALTAKPLTADIMTEKERVGTGALLPIRGRRRHRAEQMPFTR